MSLLPLAVMLRLSFACWMFTGGEILTNTFPTMTANGQSVPYIRSACRANMNCCFSFSHIHYHCLIFSYLETYLSFSSTMRNSDLGLPDSVVFVQQRVFAANVLPLFAVLCIMLAMRAVKFLWRWSPLHYLTLLWKVEQ